MDALKLKTDNEEKTSTRTKDREGEKTLNPTAKGYIEMRVPSNHIPRAFCEDVVPYRSALDVRNLRKLRETENEPR